MLVTNASSSFLCLLLMNKEEMSHEEIEARLDEIEFHILKNPTADFKELTKIIFDRINELRSLLSQNKN